MRVAVLTSGRFWLVDLARELSGIGHEVLVYSLVPPWLTRRVDLPGKCNRWLGPYVAPVLAASRLTIGTALHSEADHLLNVALDAAAARRIEPCDVLVALSGLGLRSIDAVRERYGAKVVLERGSRHILSQREILEAIPGTKKPVPLWAVQRELAGYALADLVAVPSRQVADSFLERDFPHARLFRNPYGTSLDCFRSTIAPPAEPKTIIMTGAWSLRKGCDILTQAWRLLPEVRLLHVGPVVDVPLPAEATFEHVDAVPQQELPEYYARAHVFALASREEGLALVQAQALACGLKVVCTDRTGGQDLGQWTVCDDSISVVPHDNVEALANALASALQRQPVPGTQRDQLGENRSQLSWHAYGERYAVRLRELAS